MLNQSTDTFFTPWYTGGFAEPLEQIDVELGHMGLLCRKDWLIEGIRGRCLLVGRNPSYGVSVMAYPSPLLELHHADQALLAPYGPEARGVLVPQAIDPVEVEYASIRKDAALLDLPHMGVVEVRGCDRLDFLNRMVTQELKGLVKDEARRGFWLNRKGRVEADLLLVNTGDGVMMLVDVHAVGRVIETLTTYVITEDVEILDRTADLHIVLLTGRRASEILKENALRFASLDAWTSCAGRISDAAVRMIRTDEPVRSSCLVIAKASDAPAVYETLSRRPHQPGLATTAESMSKLGADSRARRIGWHAFNIARVEAGMPLYYLDFGPDSLPHETGVLETRVSFSKGCYLGQEIVARMQSLGHPKQRLVALKPVAGASIADELHTGTPVTLTANAPQAIGSVTSSVISPMLGGIPICFAMMKHAHSSPGSLVYLSLPSGFISCEVQSLLRFVGE